MVNMYYKSYNGTNAKAISLYQIIMPGYLLALAFRGLFRSP